MSQTIEAFGGSYGVNPDEEKIIVNGQSRSLTWLLANLPAATEVWTMARSVYARRA